MADQVSNDNDLSRAADDSPVPDAHGQAAMLLVESLIHSLVSRSVLSVPEAVEIIDTAADVVLEIVADLELDIATDLGRSKAMSQRSLALLQAISASLRNDLSGA